MAHQGDATTTSPQTIFQLPPNCTARRAAARTAALSASGVVAALEAARETGVTFDGVFLAQLTQRKDIIEAARLANTAAALSTQDHGAILSIPTPDQIQVALTQS